MSLKSISLGKSFLKISKVKGYNILQMLHGFRQTETWISKTKTIHFSMRTKQLWCYNNNII